VILVLVVHPTEQFVSSVKNSPLVDLQDLQDPDHLVLALLDPDHLILALLDPDLLDPDLLDLPQVNLFVKTMNIRVYV
jgi:hypothetical protein